MFWIVIAVLIVVVTGLFAWMQLGKRSGSVAFLTEARGALRAGESVETAILAGLQLIGYRAPFSELSDEDRQFLVSTFAPLGDPSVMSPLIVEADKKQSAAVLTDREHLLAYRDFCASKAG